MIQLRLNDNCLPLVHRTLIIIICYLVIILTDMQEQQKYDIAIIGAGVYGLSIAAHLAKSECTIAIFEK